ncbi:hypothetical protein HPB48_020704 [Haemaphysalis longicornis]|uniref:LRRCT domain-containing protein n=1 Tax=Haemaphysalis longicornis TaxID=44386 RepID=A0A9J6G6X4_HAELO|nr:hypothetical protein HPB48_020704 [Haemaphysalis longicornis]
MAVSSSRTDQKASVAVDCVGNAEENQKMTHRSPSHLILSSCMVRSPLFGLGRELGIFYTTHEAIFNEAVEEYCVSRNPVETIKARETSDELRKQGRKSPLAPALGDYGKRRRGSVEDVAGGGTASAGGHGRDIVVGAPIGPSCECMEKSKALNLYCERVESTDRLRASLATIARVQPPMVYLRINQVRRVLTASGRRGLLGVPPRSPLALAPEGGGREECGLERFPPGLLDDLQLSRLSVHRSNVSEIHTDAFGGLSDCLEALRSLVLLNLSYNRLRTVGAGAFRGLVSLLRLSLLGNRIATLDAMAFQGLGEKITTLNLGENLLEQVPSESLKGLRALERLLLHENQINELLPDQFPFEGQALDTLSLANNRIRTLPGAAFARLAALRSLDLERNGLFEIHPAAFQGVHATLQTLKLGRNNLGGVPSEALQNCTSLYELNLRGNNISAVPGDAFAGFSASLRFLYLQENRVQYIEAGAFDGMGSLQWLYLHSNKIATINYNVLKPLLSSLSILDVHDNPFHCDCELSWLRQLLLDKRNIVVEHPRETRCASPEEHASTALVHLPDMQCDAPSPLDPGGWLPLILLRAALAAYELGSFGLSVYVN